MTRRPLGKGNKGGGRSSSKPVTGEVEKGHRSKKRDRKEVQLLERITKLKGQTEQRKKKKKERKVFSTETSRGTTNGFSAGTKRVSKQTAAKKTRRRFSTIFGGKKNSTGSPAAEEWERKIKKRGVEACGGWVGGVGKRGLRANPKKLGKAKGEKLFLGQRHKKKGIKRSRGGIVLSEG